MGLCLYNTLTRKVEDFVPLDGKTVRMYVCGPTVYDDPHIGHARSAYIFDVLRRYLEHKDFSVQFVRNVTDVDDKIIAKARHQTSDIRHQTQELTEQCREIAEHYLKRYHETMDRLGIGRPTKEPLATGHIDEMLNLISQLVLNGSAYETKTGDVYFAVRKFPGYGKLSNRSIDELQAGTRVEPGEQKHDPLDFALWKAAKPDEPAWNSPWGKGRPGWHIECSAMSTKYLGDEFDIHGGGVDLVFPHHENEIAQAQAVGKKFARVWIHNGLLTVNGEKMSKSLGNYITVDQALKDCGENSHADILKIFFLSAHYRSPINYMLASVTASRQHYRSYRNLIDLARNHVFRAGVKESVTPVEKAEEFKRAFFNALDDDLNTPQALSALDGMRSLGGQLLDEVHVPRPGQSVEEQKGRFLSVVKALEDHGKLLGLFERLPETDLSKRIGDLAEQAAETAISKEESTLIEQYKAARARKDFQTSDQKRKMLQEKGFIVQDTPTGSVIFRSAI